MKSERAEVQRSAADNAEDLQFGAYRAALRAFVARRIRNTQEVDDLVQEACTRLIDTARSRTLDEPQAYLFRIAANLIADSHRRATPIVQLEPDHDSPIRPAQEDGQHVRELQLALETALGELAPRCRRAFVLRRFEDRSNADIAAELGISMRMVQKYMVTAITHLYDRLGHHMDSPQ